jgi:hypothetical protein
MIRQVGPYSTLITPQAGSLFHAVLQPAIHAPVHRHDKSQAHRDPPEVQTCRVLSGVVRLRMQEEGLRVTHPSLARPAGEQENPPAKGELPAQIGKSAPVKWGVRA